MNPVCLRCVDLTICYQQRPAVHHLSVTCLGGMLVGLVGPNGAGKSTLLHGLLGWLPWTSGHVTIDGKPVHNCPTRMSLLAQRRPPGIDFPADVASIVDMGRSARRGLFASFTAEDHAVVEDALAAMGLERLRRRPLARLSGGQQQRVFVARALATGADILLLDEPLTGLDEPSAHEMMSRLRDWTHTDRLVVAVIHDLHAVQRWCTHTLLLHRELIAFGPTAEVLNPDNRDRCYAAVPGQRTP